MFRILVQAGLTCLLVSLTGCQQDLSPADSTPVANTAPVQEAAPPVQDVAEGSPALNDKAEPAEGDSRVLFDGKSLAGWKVSKFGGDGEVAAVDGEIDIESGNPLTGISWDADPIPTDNYRISLEAKRTAGIDFFCCLTFPVGPSHCSLVVGGWSGTVVGLSSVDGQDASNNETTQLISFDDDRWYRIEVAVGGDIIQAWIDGKSVLKQPITGHEFDVRNEVRLSRPLGICTFETDARIRDFRIQSTPETVSDK